MTITSDSTPIISLKQYLPTSVSHSLTRLSKSCLDKISEIRLRAGSVISVTVEGENLFLTQSGISKDPTGAINLTREQLEDFIYKFCKGSVYTHESTLCDFYITNGGIRVGIGGECIARENGKFCVGNISSLNIRIPRHIPGCSKILMEHIIKNGFNDGKGILIASNPGVGKTTLLRDLAIQLSSGKRLGDGFSPKRVTVIDERDEIYLPGIFSKSICDFLSGMTKIKGIEIACRVLSPQIIICDEIASPEEAEKITRAKNSGIIFIASIHSDSFENALKKDYIKNMFDKGVFGTCLTLSGHGEKMKSEIHEYIPCP